MRIAFFADNFYPELSGIVDSIFMTGRELEKRGHEVMYVGPYYAPAQWRMVNRAPKYDGSQELVEGMPAVRLPSVKLPYSPTGQSRLAFPTGASFTALDRFKPDIIHTHSPYGTGFEALRAAKRYRAPLVGTNHTMIEEFFPWAPRVMRRFDAWYYNHCDSITAPFQGLIERMREAGFKKPAQATPNPAEVALFAPVNETERSALRAKHDLAGPTLLYVGRLAIEKRVDVLLKGAALAKKEIPDLQIVICGSGIERRNLESLAQDLGIGKSVRFAGFVPQEALREYYRAADFFGIMSTSDSQSLGLMQAFAAGLPAIGARSQGLPDYLPETAGFLVEPGDAEGFAKRVTGLANDARLRERLGRGAVEFVAQFSPDKIAERWEKVYSSLLTSRSA